MNHERRKERNPHLYKEVSIYNDLPYEISEEKIDEIVDELIEENLLNTTDTIEIEVEINNEEKIIEIEIDSQEKTITLEEVEEVEEPVKQVSKTPLKKDTVKKQLKKA